MTADRPWESHYRITATRVVMQTGDVRVLEMTLAPGEEVPWHWHSEVDDMFYCREGTATIETRAPRNRVQVAAGEKFVVPARTAHRVHNGGPETCHVLVIQGIGAYDFRPTG